MRVTENLRFLNTSYNLHEIKSRYETIVEKMTSQKQINRLSDDPLAVSALLTGRQTLAAIEQTERNLNQAQSFLELTEKALAAVEQSLTRAQELAIAQATGTVTAADRAVAAKEVSEITQEILGLANSAHDGRHLFAGTKTHTPPFSLASSAAVIFPVSPGGTNSFNGSAQSGGAYTGIVNKTFVIKIVTGGDLASAQYRQSSDGGRTWGAVQTDLTLPVDLGDGVNVTFTAGSVPLAENDTFTVETKAPGYYYGNSEKLVVSLGREQGWSYNLPGDAVFAQAGGVDIFAVLNNFRQALETNDTTGIRNAIDQLRTAQNQILHGVAETGAKMNRLLTSQSRLSDLKFQTTKVLSQVQDADMVDLTIQFTNNEAALKASYQVAARIGGMSILDFIR
jgi:flagellar hook-associated protein 3 FlgL